MCLKTISRLKDSVKLSPANSRGEIGVFSTKYSLSFKNPNLWKIYRVLIVSASKNQVP